jgi:hypothetical protein
VHPSPGAVYAGTDPVTKKPLYLTEIVLPGPKQAREAEQARTRLLNQVDEKRNPKTRATVDQLMAKYFAVVDVDTQTLRGYRSKYERHIKPLIGSEQLARLDVEVLDSFYAQLRTCRFHCRGRRFIQHRTNKPHACDEHEGNRCPRDNPEGCRRCRRMCEPHVRRLRTVAGRLGHAGGGTTTLRVYTAWSSEADQRAAGVINARMPPVQRHADPTSGRSQASLTDRRRPAAIPANRSRPPWHQRQRDPPGRASRYPPNGS